MGQQIVLVSVVDQFEVRDGLLSERAIGVSDLLGLGIKHQQLVVGHRYN